MVLIALWITGILTVVLLFKGDGSTKKALKQSGKTIVKNESKSDVWLYSTNENLKSGEDFDINVYANTKGNNLGVFALDFNFDKNILVVDISKGKDGLSKGRDGENFIVMSNPNDISDGHFRFSGICAQDCANGDQKHIATIHAKSEADLNFSDIANQLELKELADDFGKPIAFEEKNGVIIIK